MQAALGDHQSDDALRTIAHPIMVQSHKIIPREVILGDELDERLVVARPGNLSPIRCLEHTHVDGDEDEVADNDDMLMAKTTETIGNKHETCACG